MAASGRGFRKMRKEPRVAAVADPLAKFARLPFAGLFGLPQLASLYEHADGACSADVAAGIVNGLGVKVVCPEEERARIPAEGPAVIVANHPFGGLEGMIMMSLMCGVRPDVRVLANHLLAVFPRLKDAFILVNPFEGAQARRDNIKGIKETMSWLAHGGAVGTFPAGAVAHWQSAVKHVTDERWNANITTLGRRAGAVFVPMFFAGGNGLMFQMAGMLHPRLRTALLAREVVNKANRTCVVHVGTPITGEELARFNDDQATEYLRLRTYALAGREAPAEAQQLRRRPPMVRKPARAAVAVAPPQSREVLEGDIASLPPEALVATGGDLQVFRVNAEQIPHLLTEVGRLREITFRAVGEGTGKPLDLDEFDRNYLHLLLWHKTKGELVGSYRLGLTDRLLAARGQKGLYISTLFDFGHDFLSQLGTAVELGRSFIRPEYQNRPSPLMLLWQGIGHFVVTNPAYRYLLGPVSISNRYRPASRALIMKYLTQPQFLSPLAHLMRPRQPLDPRRTCHADVLERVQLIRDLGDLNRIISDIEPDGKGVPSLLRQYLKLGAKVLAFNIDPSFGHCLDCLCLFDGAAVDNRSVRHYADDASVTKFKAHHGR